MSTAAACLQEVSDFTLFDLNDIDKAFTKTVKPVKHHQPVNLVLQGTHLRIVGYPAGHMLGGTVWVLEAGSEVVVYGVDTNHNKERCALFSLSYRHRSHTHFVFD
jgi:Cft2 family RNA processing exonuclease